MVYTCLPNMFIHIVMAARMEIISSFYPPFHVSWFVLFFCSAGIFQPKHFQDQLRVMQMLNADI